MKIENPHGPPHESSSFWYDTHEKALLFEVIFRNNAHTPEADHSSGRAAWATSVSHYHLDPHGIRFADSSPTDDQENDVTNNIELVIRLWHQVINGEQTGRPDRTQRFVPVPTTLALFLTGRRNQMHHSDSITQALALLQANVAIVAKHSAPDQP